MPSGLRTYGVVLVTVLATVAALMGWRVLDGAVFDGRVTREVCWTDATLSGLQGYCIQRRRWYGALFSDGRTELHIVPMLDGERSRQITAVPYPFPPDEGFYARFEDGVLLVSNEATGVTVTYPRSFYRLR